jgi:DNA-damage-inducible protein J
MYDHQAKKLNEQGTFKEIVVEISARQLSAKSEALQQMSLFLTQAVAHNGFPFEIKRTVHNPYTSMTEDEMFQRLEQSRESSKNGNYRNADAVISDMRGKYAL